MTSSHRTTRSSNSAGRCSATCCPDTSCPKVRAQVGDPDIGGGVLAACIDQGVDQKMLRTRFAELHKLDRPGELDQFIRAGRYRAAVPEETS